MEKLLFYAAAWMLKLQQFYQKCFLPLTDSTDSWQQKKEQEGQLNYFKANALFDALVLDSVYAFMQHHDVFSSLIWQF